MKKQFIVANFKSHLVEEDAKAWLDVFLEYKQELANLEAKEIIIAPSFTLLSMFKSRFKDSNFKTCAQDISPFDEGAFTGEVNGKQIKDYADYVIIGHSERRTNFNELDDRLSEKVKQAIQYGLKPIFCIQDKDTFVPDGVEIIAYEPIFAIGTGNSATSEDVENVSKAFLSKNDNLQVLYGGSVTSSDVKLFTNSDTIKGVLVGGASLNPREFIGIIKNA